MTDRNFASVDQTFFLFSFIGVKFTEFKSNHFKAITQEHSGCYTPTTSDSTTYSHPRGPLQNC